VSRLFSKRTDRAEKRYLEATSVDEGIISEHILSDQAVAFNPGKIIDSNNAHEIVSAITTAQKQGFRYIIIDLAEVEFLSSAGVGSILNTIEASRDSGGDVVLCNVSPTILHSLDDMGLADVLTIMADDQEAAAHCGIRI